MAVDAVKTAGAMVLSAFQTCGIVAKDEALDASDNVVGLARLNDMLKGWQQTGARLYTRATGSVTLTDATASYTVTNRPLRLKTVKYRPASGSDLVMVKMSAREYDELPDQDTAGTPTQYFYDRGRETGTIYVWPVLATVTTETLQWTGIGEVADIEASSDTVEAPAEWYDAIRYGLAARLCDDYDVPEPKASKIAAQAKALYNTAMGGEREESVVFEMDRYYRFGMRR